jgi:methyltransferase (TIGR00027 family)
MLDKPSRTAERVALRRAAHQLLDDPKVLDDPLAIKIIGTEAAAALAADPHAVERHPALRLLRAFLAVRSRIAEDEVSAAVARGVRRYVVLGAGFDTFAYRNPFPDLRIVEVDHPRTQEWKRARLAEVGISVPPNVQFVPIDFALQDLDHELRLAGVVASGGTMFSWLGVTPYLESDTTFRTLQSISGLAGDGGGVVFDYAVPPTLLDAVRRAALARFTDRLAAIGEPWRSFFEPREILERLSTFGFRSVKDWGPEDLNAQYFSRRTDALRVGSLGHVVVARV